MISNSRIKPDVYLTQVIEVVFSVDPSKLGTAVQTVALISDVSDFGTFAVVHGSFEQLHQKFVRCMSIGKTMMHIY
jgi:hypothetical protein